MTISFLTPVAALVALVGAVAVAVAVFGERRLEQLCRLLGLEAPSQRATLAVKVAIVVLTALVGLAVAQPVATTEAAVRGRTDTQVFFVFDVTRSMAARSGVGAPSRLQRARADALELRNDLPGLPVGVASLTDRLLPLLFPTPRTNSFLGVIDRALGIDKPPAELPWGTANGTKLSVLGDLVRSNYFDPQARRRIVVVLTDGETRPFNAAATGKLFARRNVHLVFVHVWAPNERVFDSDGSPNPFYLPDPATPQNVRFLAAELGAPVFDERQLPQAAGAVRAAAGTGKEGVLGHELQSRMLSPFLLLIALVPLGFILWRRNLGHPGAESADAA
jgi:hypothetical protein